MDELWSSGSYEPHLLSLPFAFAPAAILIVIAYTIAMRGAPAIRGWLLLHCVSLLPYAIIMTIAPSTTEPEAVAQLFRFGAAFIPMAVAAGTGFQYALLKRRSPRDRAVVWIGVASALAWIAIGSVTDAAVTGVHRIGSTGLWYANAGPWAWLALLHAFALSMPGYSALIRAAIWGKASRERRQHRIMLAANLVTYAGLVDVGLAYNIGVFPVGWLLAGIGSLVVLRAILVDDLLRVRALDTSAPRLVALFVATVLLSWVALSLVDRTTWWGTTLTLLQCCIGVRVSMSVVGLVNRGARVHEGPLDRLLAQLVSRARAMTTETEIAQFAAETIELGIGAHVEVLLASDADWGWTTMTGERLADTHAPDPLLGGWLVDQHRTVFADDPEREVPADLAPLLEALLVGHAAHSVVPVSSADQLLGLVVVPASASRLRGLALTFVERAAERLGEALVHAGMVERAAERAALTREIELAQAVQAELLPPRGARTFGNLAVIGSWRPATSVAGDFWGVYPLDDDRTLIAIGDVTGHGVASAMVTAAAVGACDAAARRAGGDLDLRDLARALDLAVRHVGGGQLAMTCFASVIDQKANLIRYVSCGHTAPYVLRAAGDKADLQALVGRGNPLGSGAEAAERFKVLERSLDPGDLVVWYTDGVIDAKDPSGKPFGDRRLQQLLRRLEKPRVAPVGVHDALHASLAAHRAGQPLADDETLVVAQLGAIP